MQKRLVTLSVRILPALLLSLSFLVPRATAAGLATPPLIPPLQESQGGFQYTVQAGDTLWDIAVAHGITVEKLIAANDLADPSLLRAGQVIFVPAQPIKNPQAASPAAATAVPAPAGTPIALPADLPAEIAGWPAKILALINDKRAAQGLPALAWSPELASVAQAHAADCAQHNRGSHVGSDGASLLTRLDRAGYVTSRASENWANAQDVGHAFGLWWNESPGNDPHRRNILGANYTEIGIGIARGPWGYYFIADFGSR